jgi:hypothetical protein
VTLGRARACGLAALVALSVPQARAFPGVLVAKDGAERHVTATTIVLMRYRGISIVTLMPEYEGPLTPFAFLVPVPADVQASAVKTLRRGVLGRVEALSAPRFHAFFEQDPCGDDSVEQSWDEHLKAKGAGFLAPPGLPPLDRHYAVSNAIGVPVEPTFKERESEFEYHELVFESGEQLRSALAARAYRIQDSALAALSRELTRGQKLLLAEVLLAHVELSSGSRVQLGGMRYVTHAPALRLPEALGAENGHAPEDVLVVVLDREARFELKNQDDVFPPLAVRVEPEVADHLASAYDGLFDAVAARHPEAFVTEFAWKTSGCGEPCPDVPLAPDELMTLGGDVLEAQTTTAQERAPEPPVEPFQERERFDEHLADLRPRERPAAEREHQAERREIERRRALTARQTYVLTRLHHRYAASAERLDIELGPAPPVTGGVGVPAGARGELSAVAMPSAENRLQVRFFGLKSWPLGVACSEPKRWRWGKRWASEARTPRAVPLALDLAAATRDRSVLEQALLQPLPELGLTPAPPGPRASAEPTPSATPHTSAKPSGGCGVVPRSPEAAGLPVWFDFCGFLALLRGGFRVRPRAFPRAASRRA